MADEAKTKPERLITITVNNKPVNIEGPKTTGLEIKQAAIAQGVNIELDFQLAELKPKRQIVGDDEEITINKNSKFVATAPDDNS